MGVMTQERHDIVKTAKIKTTKDILPIQKIYPSGMFKLPGSRFSHTYELKDVDYSSVSDDSRQDIFERWSDVLNSLDGSKASAKLTIINRHINKNSALRQSLIRTDMRDGYDSLRAEYNRLRTNDIQGDNSFIQDKYLTISAYKRDEEKATAYFRRLESDIDIKLKGINSGIKALSPQKRGEILHSFLRSGHESEYSFTYVDDKKNTQRFIDTCASDYIRPHMTYFECGEKVGRAMIIRSLGNQLKDEFLTRLSELKTNLLLTTDIIPVSNADAKKLLEHKDDDVESNAHIWSNKKSVREGSAMRLPRQVAKDRKIIDAYNKAMDEDNQKMFLVQVIIVFLADNMNKLEEYTESILDTAAEMNCEMSYLFTQQIEGLIDALPIGIRKIRYLRDCDTDTTAIMMPFNVVKINHDTGIPYGRHETTREQQCIDRRIQTINAHEWIFGVSGGGKSGNAKLKILYESLLTSGDVVLLDPDGEYAPLVRKLGGQVVTVGVDSINVAGISRDYGYVDENYQGDPIKKKSNLITSFFEAILDENTVFGETEKSLVDRAVRQLYTESIGTVCLEDIYDLLITYQYPEANKLALALERHIKGSFNSFAQKTTVNTDCRIVCYDLSKLDKQEKDAGLIVVLDQVDQRLIKNRKIGRETYVTIDEMDYFFKHASSTSIIEDFFERARKYGGYLRAIVQNITKLLDIPAAVTMLQNSENVIMLRQHPDDARVLQKMYGLSSIQVKELINAENGHGINKIGNILYSFDGTIPEESLFFPLINTTISKM